MELFRAHGDVADVAEALYKLSFPVGYFGDLDRAEALLDEWLQISERIGRPIGVGRAHWGMGDMSTFREDWSSSIEHMERAVEVFRDLDAPFDLGWAWFMLAFSQVKMGNPQGAVAPLQRALDIFAEVGDLSAMALVLDVASMLRIEAEEGKSIAYLIGAAKRIKVDTGIAIGDVGVNQYAEVEAFLSSLTEVEGAAYDEGSSSTLDEAVEAAHAALSDLNR